MHVSSSNAKTNYYACRPHVETCQACDHAPGLRVHAPGASQTVESALLLRTPAEKQGWRELLACVVNLGLFVKKSSLPHNERCCNVTKSKARYEGRGR
jgi:hypothetical protein